jgi:hypothetical protein
MAIQDQAVWASVNVPHPDKGSVNYKRGELLPAPASEEEAAARSLLRLGGALRTVEVVYTPEELAEQAQGRAELAAAAAVAADPDADPAEHPPTLTATHGSPVVIGPPEGQGAASDDVPQYTGEPGAAAAKLSGTPDAGPGTGAAAAAADEIPPDGAEDAGPAPHANAAKAQWVDYAERRGMPRDQAEGMTRDQLVMQFGR